MSEKLSINAVLSNRFPQFGTLTTDTFKVLTPKEALLVAAFAVEESNLDVVLALMELFPAINSELSTFVWDEKFRIQVGKAVAHMSRAGQKWMTKHVEEYFDAVEDAIAVRESNTVEALFLFDQAQAVCSTLMGGVWKFTPLTSAQKFAKLMEQRNASIQAQAEIEFAAQAKRINKNLFDSCLSSASPEDALEFNTLVDEIKSLITQVGHMVKPNTRLAEIVTEVNKEEFFYSKYNLVGIRNAVEMMTRWSNSQNAVVAKMGEPKPARTTKFTFDKVDNNGWNKILPAMREEDWDTNDRKGNLVSHATKKGNAEKKNPTGKKQRNK